MTQQPITPYEPQPLSEPAGIDLSNDGQQGSGLAPLVQALRRRWLMIVIIWLVLGPPAAAFFWLTRQATYTATAQVEVKPVLPSILYDQNNAMPMYDTYLNTQAQIMSSQQVLMAALADRSVQDLPLVHSPKALNLLRASLQVFSLPRTHLVQLSVTQDDPEAAVRLAKAVLDAYMARAAGADVQTERVTRQILEREQQRLREKLDQQSQEIRRLAEQYGTASETMFETLRETLEEYTVETKRELERADSEVMLLEQQLKQVEEGKTVNILSEEDFARREQAIEMDAGVRWMREQTEQKVARLAHLRSVYGETHKDVVEIRKELERLQADLANERRRAAEDIDKQLAMRQKEGLAETKARLENQLALARQRRDMLQQRVDQSDAKSMSIGRQALEIQSLQEQRELTRQDYQTIVERLRRLDIESQQPATRISVASVPEIRPGGVQDKRKKMAVAAAVGMFFIACLAGLVRDRLDPHLKATEQVEAGVGLRLLGAVPSVAELQAGRVTREHFLESYRLIRTTLAGIGGEGHPPRSILITSAQAAEGKTSLAVSLAISLAEPGNRVLLIDGDIQAPQIARLLKMRYTSDLKHVLTDQLPLAECVTATGIPGLDVLAGHADVRASLNTRSASRVVQCASAVYDHVVIDSPPALGAADALVWAQSVEGVVIASLLGHSDTHAIKLACQRITGVGGRLLGSVIANVSINETYYSYSSTSQRPNGHGLDLGDHVTRRTPPLVHLPVVDVDRPKEG